MNIQRWMPGLFFTVTALLVAVTDVYGYIGFVCVTKYATIDIKGTDDLFIWGVTSFPENYLAHVTFGRATNTGTSTGLTAPSSLNRDKLLTGFRMDFLPHGVERIGAFYCNARLRGVNEKITTIIMSESSTVRPRDRSQTVNIGEQVTFTVDTDVDVSTLRWRHNGERPISSLDGQVTYTIPHVTLADTGVYECYEDTKRAEGVHAIFQLIVRACPSGKWNLPNCDSVCPICLNNGVCDERSGRCVCAPGFNETNCENAMGRNRMGLDGVWQCSNRDEYRCRGNLFCHPHPYGCSCQAGYKGLNCDEDCLPGTFGASCRSQCHCASGVPCALDTGVCPGECEDGWSGVNCQQRCSETPEPVSGLKASVSENEITITWEPDNTLCIKTYRVEYELIQHSQCQSVEYNDTTVVAGYTSSTSYAISGVFYNSIYQIYITTIFNDTLAGERANTSQLTIPSAAPSGPPQNVSLQYTTSTAMTFTWTQPICVERRGEILAYSYALTGSDDYERYQNVSDTFVRLEGLQPFTNYSFSISALTEKGSGPSMELAVMTDEAAPSGSPQNVSVQDITSNAMTFTWTLPNCEERNGEILAYSYALTGSDGYERYQNVSDTFVRLEGLQPSTNYTFSISALTVKGLGPSAEVAVSTAPANYFKLTNIRSTSVITTWHPDGITTEFKYSMHRAQDAAHDQNEDRRPEVGDSAYTVSKNGRGTMLEQLMAASLLFKNGITDEAGLRELFLQILN